MQLVASVLRDEDAMFGVDPEALAVRMPVAKRSAGENAWLVLFAS